MCPSHFTCDIEAALAGERLAVHLEREQGPRIVELGERQAVVIAAAQDRDRIEPVEREVRGGADSTAGFDDAPQRRARPARLADEARRSHEVIAVAGAFHHEHAFLPRQRA
jgi:hypothetical protein